VTTPVRIAAAGAIATATAAALTLTAKAGGRWAVGRTEARLCTTAAVPPYVASDRARALHAQLWIADLHADSLLWGRDLLQRGSRGHVDVPRLVEGNVALQVLAASTKSPRHLNLDRNDDRSDDVVLLAIALGWPPATWRRLLPRALYMASRADRFAARSDGRLRIIRTAADLAAYDADRAARPHTTAGLLAIEGAHALDGDPANVDAVADAGFRMMGPAHFFDNVFAGSAHGVEKGGLTDLGREMVRRMEERSMLVDVAHASSATVDDVLAIAQRPVIASHTGLRGVVDSVRNLTDEQARGIAETGGILGIGFWPTVCGGATAGDIARAIAHAIRVAGIEHVALGSDFDGAVPVPFDSTGLVLLTDALIEAGLDDDAIRKVMGGNVHRLLAETLPTGDQTNGAMSSAALAAPSVSTGR
jgi:microsomal dipeptidase-like Zn-dependent dipeptidase